jgi:hypothetical protein
MKENVTIIKATGEREIFDPQKLHNSLRKAGAKEDVAQQIISAIVDGLKDGETTKDIYFRAFDLLKKESEPKVTARYSLRNAIMDLGPSGFPFEQFVAEIFRAKGFETTTDFIAKGHCAEHEIDIVAWNPEKLIMVEAKFHNVFGIKSDLKVALYVKARWEDLADQEFDFPISQSSDGASHKRKLDEGWLVTNTKFSEAAIKYANCRGMKLVGWNYPMDGSLQDLIEEAHLHPITCLTSINPSDEKILMNSGIVLCKQAKDNPDVVAQAGLGKDKISKMMAEIELIQN